MLETLEREHLFVVALDDERRWSRYHHLFADALRARLGAWHPERVDDLHGAAAGGSPPTGCWATPCGTRMRAATTSAPPSSSSSRWPTCAGDVRIAPFATGWPRCPTTSSVAAHC